MNAACWQLGRLPQRILVSTPNQEPDRWPTVPDADLNDGSHTALGETFPRF